ncbi:WD40 repeat-like protein [Choiromyces venosus 120613-1]|uniref:WD40 repeat-like protein n=1 Tax=Choiromyces venosus 120613-1 TaxID=1336337 RepID=A0A3N4J6S1_9PEZI|nr:WD40 repeat-like protein [Choiromyces venosus 120613-1]
MTSTSILPSIKISKSGAAENSAQNTPIPSPITPTSDLGSDNGKAAASTRKDGQNASSANGSLPSKFSKPSTSSISTVDLERLQSPKIKNKGMGLDNSATVDPLTMQILRRTGTENTLRQKLRKDSYDDSMARNPGESMGGIGERNAPDAAAKNTDAQPQGREKKKGVSFLSRIMGGKKKGGDMSNDEDTFEGDIRTEGMDAHVFSQPIGYIPQFPAPPKYIRVRSHNKPKRDFDQTFLAQELYRKPNYEENGKPVTDSTANLSSLSLALPKHKSGAIWAMKFSKDGRYLAAGGQDKIVRVWQVIRIYSSCGGVRLNAPVFLSEPIREYAGHTADVLDLSWSKNNFLLSSSMDKTVRLWHVSRDECLCAFQHSDFVTAIVFHPRDDRFFLAGSLDSKLRLWSIPDKSVAFWNELPDLITAVAFTPDGRMAIAGCLNGLCLFYETEGLRYNTQVHVRSSHGRNAKGSKITGIETITFPPDDPNGEVKLLITSNDSRVRMYNARDKSLELKFKGYENTCSQIHATFSDDAKYVISGSEDGRVYIWNVGLGETEKKDKRPVEYFEAHPAIVTVGVMAPTKTRQLLGSSGDPLYDLCNPPPVTLVSRSDSISSKKETEASATEKRSEDDHATSHMPKVPEESPAYVARSAHSDGNIIVTADYTGRIKVFRQDCAHVKRKNESWETSSTFSKKIGSGVFGGRRRNSLSHGSDRILSWRQSIASSGSLDGSIRGGRYGDGNSSRNRSISPRKSMGALSIGSNGTTGRFARSGSVRSRATSIANDTVHQRNSEGGTANMRSPGKLALGEGERPGSSATMPVTGNDRMTQEGSANLAYYNPKHLPTSGVSAAATAATAGLRRGSRMTMGSDDSADEVFSSDGEGDESENETVRCKRCGGTSFKAKQSRRGEHKLLCVK